MRIRIGEDEFTIWFADVDNGDPLGGPHVVEMPAIDFADYKRVQSEFEEWQRRLCAAVVKIKNVKAR